MDQEQPPPSFPSVELPGYAPAAFNPQILVHPLEDRVSFLDNNRVGGIIYVKGVGPGWTVSM